MTIDRRRKHFCRSCVSVRCAIGVGVWLVMLVTIALLVSFGYLQQFGDWVRDTGALGYFLFILLFWLIALPFGWGFTVLAALSGFTYGWFGWLVTYAGAVTGSSAAFVLQKYFAKDCLRKRLDGEDHMVAKVGAAMLRKHNNFLFLLALRLTPLTIGMVTGLEAAINVGFFRFLFSSALVFTIDVSTSTNLGVQVRQLGDADTSEKQLTSTITLAVSIIVTVLIIVVAGAYGRKVMKDIEVNSLITSYAPLETLDNDFDVESFDDSLDPSE